MDAVVIALPPESTPARLGERFKLRETTPLRIGPGREARLRVGPDGAGELLVLTTKEGSFVRLTPPALRASLCGEELSTAAEAPLREGDSLYVHPGLVLEFRGTPRGLPFKHRELEEVLCTSDDEATWTAYRDQLEQHGDPLASWLLAAPRADERERRRQLLGLAESVRGRLADVTWSPRGMLSSVTLSREAVTGAPGLVWHLDRLSGLAVARLLPRLAIALFAGSMPSRFRTGEDPDAVAARTLERLALFDGVAALRSVSLGFVSEPGAWPRAQAAWLALREAAPLLATDWQDVVVCGARATLRFSGGATGGVAPVADEFVLNPLRTDVGTGASCLVRLVGAAPTVCCTLSRTVEGQWVVFDESADPFRPATGPHALRVNGAITARAALAPGDVVEPVAGVRLVFNITA